MDKTTLNIKNHKFEAADQIRHIACSKNTTLFDNGQPDTIVIHFTGGISGKSSAEYLARDSVKASAHIVLDKTGLIYQLVPFNIISWHAGESLYNGREGYNRYAIGIEIDNAGVLEPIGKNFKSWFGKIYNEEEVIKAKHQNESIERYWNVYSEAQIEKIQMICESLKEAYPTIKDILGHDEIAPKRKLDPGPAFPMEKLRSLVLERRDQFETYEKKSLSGRVNVSNLNIRQIPGVNSELVSAPLKEGTTVKIMNEHNGWYQVRSEIEGWVAGKYVTLE